MGAAADEDGEKKMYLGVDVGGTKTLAALAKGSGKIVSRSRRPTPRGGKTSETLKAIRRTMEEALVEAGGDAASVKAAGVAVPGVIDADGRVVFSPNTNLAGARPGAELSAALGVPVALGNDVNCGALGEKWLGSAGWAADAVCVFVGTGIGGGIILNGRLHRGRRGAAGELGHMQMRADGPTCGCGAPGCLEALASRTAMERDIRAAADTGRQTVLTDLLEGDLRQIKSSMLRKALEREDPVVTEVVSAASEVLGRACLNLRHLLDPEVIVLGGGVVEACERFIMPIVERVTAGDTLLGPGPGAKVVVSALGDDAVVLGAVALARQAAGEDPLAEVAAVDELYPTISDVGKGTVAVGGKTYDGDIYIRADGKVKNRRKLLAKVGSSPGRIDRPELEKVCRYGPGVLFVSGGGVRLTREGRLFLRRRGIDVEVGGGPDAFNDARRRKAAIVHLAG